MGGGGGCGGGWGDASRLYTEGDSAADCMCASVILVEVHEDEGIEREKDRQTESERQTEGQSARASYVRVCG